ncbi:MAG: 50S ribosomal protein L25 [Actinobacteria bacterium]|nr:50S ribosomal protein L25 [Actinomycetota bacterium]MBM3714050.1 50S ribosomal protein L25 [Actinomycetota bacterium]
MRSILLKAETRNKDELKKNSSRRLRNEGFIPATIYGQSEEPVSVKFNTQEFKDIIKGHSISNLILDIQIKSDGRDKKETTIIKEIQRGPISADLLHVDFLRIQMKKEVETIVPVVILSEEESAGVKEEGGVVQHGLRELHVLCLPADIPEKVEYDIKELHIGHNIRVSDLAVMDGIKILNHPEEVIVSIIHPTHMVIEQPAAEVGAELEEEAAEPELITKEKASAKEKEED